MARPPASPSPVDRAAAELEQQIAALQQQVQRLEDPHGKTNATPPGLWDRLMRALRPPGRTPALPPRRDLFDISPNPVKDLEADPISFAPREPDLFSQNRGAEQKEKLAQYLQAGSLGAQKPLRHVQRRNKRQFFIWLGLGLLVVVIIWKVVR